MIIRKAFKYRLRPNQKAKVLFLQFAGAARWIYNRGLAQRKKAWEEEKRSISLYEQNKELTLLKKEPDTAWLKDVHSQVIQQSLGDLDQAYSHFFQRLKLEGPAGYPRFKCKGEHDSFRYPQGVKIDDDKVYLPKIG